MDADGQRSKAWDLQQLSFSELEVRDSSKIFRPIHYIGSKLRIVEPIRSVIDELDPARGPVCDLFSGSGTVSAALSRDRNVISVDIQEYSRVLCSALLRPVEPDPSDVREFRDALRAPDLGRESYSIVQPLVQHERACIRMALEGDPEPLCDMLEHGSIIAYELGVSEAANFELRSALQDASEYFTSQSVDLTASTALRYFGGIYFSYAQAQELDRILVLIEQYTKAATRDTFLAALLSTASDIVNTVGKQFAQPIRPRDSSGNPKRHLVRQIERDRSLSVTERFEVWLDRYLDLPITGRSHRVYQMDYYEMLKNFEGDIGVVYADPPYTRDHYSRFYHVLETLSRRDNPEVSKLRVNGEERLSRGIYRKQRHQSPFCIRSQAPGAFADLFDLVASKGLPLVLSYSPDTTYKGSRPRVVSIDMLESLAKQAFRSVEYASAGAISHSRLNSAERTLGQSEEAEVLFLCRP